MTDAVVTMESDLFSMFGSNTTLESEGVWIVYGADPEKDPAFKIARAGGDNRKYTQNLVKKARPYQRVINNQGNAPDESTLKLLETLQQQAFVESCLLDWRNVRPVKGGPVEPFSHESAYKLFKMLPDLYRDLSEQAQALSTFRREQVGDAAKN